jgi:hypothetical protein
LPRLRFYGILLALMIMTTREQPIQKLATRDGSFTAGRQATLFLAGTLTLATLFVVLVMGSLTEPDFWRLVRLVDVAAELIMFATVSLLSWPRLASAGILSWPVSMRWWPSWPRMTANRCCPAWRPFLPHWTWPLSAAGLEEHPWRP